VSSEKPGHVLRGRHIECGALDRLLASVGAGQSSVLVVRGEAGVGKSALLDYVADKASGFRVTRATGNEYETELAYAGLHQLCAPYLELRDRLPGPQRVAIETAFGLSAHAPSDRFVVGLAVLGLLSEAADQVPLLCVVDDAQWLDGESAMTLAFVARRLQVESVGLVFAVREPSETRELDGLPEVRLRGLREDDARAVLAAAWPGRLDEQVRDRVIGEARGNPLALVELSRGLTPDDLAGGFELPDAPLSNRIELSFVRQLDALPDDTCRLLLTAAAEPTGDLALLWRASELQGLPTEAVQPAEAAGLLEVGAQVRFRHPLVRSAVYQAAPAAHRRLAHLALAEATDPVTDPDRRAWHRGRAASGLDAEVADELERSAGRARARGGISAAASFLERAAELTPDPSDRGRRALAAARARLESGALEAASALLGVAESARLDDFQEAMVAWLRAQIVFARRRGFEAPPLLLEAARRLEPHDVDLAHEGYLEALGATIYASRMHGAVGPREVAAAFRASRLGRDAERPVELLLDGLATRFTDGYVAAVPPLERALMAIRRDDAISDDELLRWFWLPWLVAGDLWDDETWEAVASRAVRVGRASGALTAMPLALGYRAFVHMYAGEFAEATVLNDEGYAIQEGTGSARVNYPRLLLSAWRGSDPDGLLRSFEAELAEAAERGEARGISGCSYSTAVLHNGLGRYAAALSAARIAVEYDDLSVLGLALPELIEAAVRAGADDEAANALARLKERTDVAGTNWALGVQAWSSALLSSDEAADSLYREAIERLSHTRVALHLARAHLSYGEWLRRGKRRVDARTQLRTAHEMFSTFGAEGFAERAGRELSATGETVRSQHGATQIVLTSQEAQIARLARVGMSNPEIGAELYISRHTVEWHMRKVLAKLGITSRNQLGELPLSRLDTA
jgi:DNA-binding CsgD family transcriptional regulator